VLISKTKFRGIAIDQVPAAELFTFEQCSFDGVALGMKTKLPQDRLQISNCSVTSCTASALHVGPVAFRDCVLDSLATSSVVWLNGCVFDKCVLKGRLGSFLHFEEKDPTESRDGQVNKPFIEENFRFHMETEWALDISEAIFVDLDLRGVPAERVKINGTNQVKVLYEPTELMFQAGAFQQVELCDYIGFCLEPREDSRRNFVLTTNSQLPDYRRKMELFAFMAKHGLLA
jgi:hypothetical protein